MPKVELIDASAVPATRSLAASLIDAMEHLRNALRANQALKIQLGPDERAQAYTNTYKRAAKDLQIGVRVTWDMPRAYRGKDGVERTEPSILYIRITKAAAQLPPKVPSADGLALSRRPIQIPPDRIEREPITGALVSR